jgi:pectinesterase
MAFNLEEGDLTHFNEKGAEAMTDLILQGLKQAEPTLASYVK